MREVDSCISQVFAFDDRKAQIDGPKIVKLRVPIFAIIDNFEAALTLAIDVGHPKWHHIRAVSKRDR